MFAVYLAFRVSLIISDCAANILKMTCFIFESIHQFLISFIFNQNRRAKIEEATNILAEFGTCCSI